MNKYKYILQNRKGDVFIFIVILVFFILTLSAILIEYFRMESLYQQVEYVLQRGVNASVEYAMLDEYRRDGHARMDSALAEERLYEYLHESIKLDADLSKYIAYIIAFCNQNKSVADLLSSADRIHELLKK